MSRSLAGAFALILIGAGPPAPVPHSCGAHIVVRGDTLYSIARRCRSSVAAIAAASGLADPRRIEIGQRLVIPDRAAPAPAPGREEEASSYRIRPADTLYSLARWARVSLPALLAANPGIDPRKIEIGDAVRLPAGAADPEPRRSRERGPGAPPPREMRREAPPAAPPADKPDEDDEPEPEGM